MSTQVVKIELKGKRFLELAQAALKDQLPTDAAVEAAYYLPGSDVVGVLVASKDYPVVEGGDLVFYAKAVELVSAKELKAVIEQAQAQVQPTVTAPTLEQSPVPGPSDDSGKTGTDKSSK